MNGAIYVQNSSNTKINGSAPADATYASIAASCPSTCPLKNEGCYAQNAWLGNLARRLDKEAKGQDVSTAEAAAIDGAYAGGAVPKGRALRLHVSGDASTTKAARAIAAAVRRWKKRGGGAAWNYTHAWRNVSRAAWTGVSTLASIESPALAKLVRKRGYAPALIVAEHPPDGRAWDDQTNGVRWIPCPSQTRGIGCTDCRLCFDADALFQRKSGIAFAMHGGRRLHIKRHLAVLQER